MPAMKPKVRDDLAIVEIEGEAIVYDDQNGQLHHLNPTATVVFNLCDGQSTVKEFAADIADVYSLPPGDVERQVRALIRAFRESGLLDINHSKRRKD
jgi:PqqD family protein of HPr-rel-A system